MTVTSESDGGGGPLPAPQFFCLTPTLLAIFFLAPTLHCWRPKTRYENMITRSPKTVKTTPALQATQCTKIIFYIYHFYLLYVFHTFSFNDDTSGHTWQRKQRIQKAAEIKPELTRASLLFNSSRARNRQPEVPLSLIPSCVTRKKRV